MPSTAASAYCSGLTDSSLPVCKAPSGARATMSVKVPPRSIQKRQVMFASPMLGFTPDTQSRESDKDRPYDQRLGPVILRSDAVFHASLMAGLHRRITQQEAEMAIGRAGFEVYRGRGRHAQRVKASSGGVLLSLLIAWLRRGA
ncbi:hypothetical protein D3C85_1224150 [compost metagenome]